MAIEFAPRCFDPDEPVQPDWADIDDPAEATGHYADGWEAEPQFRVVTRDVERAADALLVVAERFERVSPTGHEYGPDDEVPLDEDTEMPHNLRVCVDDDAAYVRALTHEWLPHAQSERMKWILVQELTLAGVDAVIEADYGPIRWSDARRWPADGS